MTRPADRTEPAHVHVERDECTAKFWLSPVYLEWNRGFSRSDIARIGKLIEENLSLLMEAWREYFAS